MTDIDELRKEHEEIRAELALLDDIVPAVHEVPVVASHILDTLARALRHHCVLEDRLVTTAAEGRRHIDPDLIRQMHDAHHNQRIRLAVLHALLADRPPGYAPRVMMQTRELLAQVRTYLIREEEWCAAIDEPPDERSQHVDVVRAERDAMSVGVT